MLTRQTGSRNPSRIPPEPSDSDEIRRIIDNAVKNGAVDIKVVKCVFLGPPEAGKTQLRRALVENYTKSQESTPASTQATPVIDLLVAGSKKWEHFNFRHMSTFSRSRVSNKNTASKDKHNARKFNSTQSDQEPIAEEITGSISLESPHKESANMEANEPESDLETFQRLYEAIRHNVLKESGTSTMDNLEAIRLIYVVDSGGQPSFVDFHSVTATFPASYLLVYNMEQGLDWKPQYTLRKKIDTKVLPNNTQSNADMIKRSLLTVHHLKSKFSDRNKQIKALLMEKFCQCDEPPIFIVGTHKDQATVKNDCERLKRLYGNIPLMRQVVHRRFVDSLSEGCEGIKELRETMSDKGSLCSFRLPLSWFHLHLMAMSLESEEIPNRNLQVQSYGDLCKMCMKSGLVESEEEFNAMIVVLHSLGVFSCPDFELCEGTDDSMGKETIIFLSPSLLYGYVSVILEIPFRNLDRTMHKPSLLRLQGAGELTAATLAELEIPRNLGSCKDFHNSLLKWLVNWGLAAKMDGEKRYFIPSVLPPKADLKQPVRGAKYIDLFPFYICFVEQCSNNFTFHYLPDGIFPHFIVNLLKAGYVLPQNNPDTASTDNCPRCRNAILLIRSRRQFKCRNTFNVQLSDENDRLSVNMYPADVSVPSDTVLKEFEAGEVLSELKQIMQETNLNSNHASTDELRLCSRCPCFEADSEGSLANLHLSLIDRIGSSNYVMSCLHSKRLEIGAWERQNSSKSTNHVLQGFYTSQDSHVGSGDCEEPCEPPMISAQLGNSHSNVTVSNLVSHL
jgi:GTPase SAR1 family protein